MCYDLAFLTRKEIKYAKRFGTDEDISDLEERLRTFHATGFDHPEVPVIYNREPTKIRVFEWGLIPFWAKDLNGAIKIRQSTLNARAETIFTKPAFRDAAEKGNRCLVLVDGFFEHHHKGGKTFPYYISREDGQPFALAGLWWKWHGDGFTKDTFTVITTEGNSLLSRIHNNPKLEGPRMPAIIPQEFESTWLKEGISQQEVIELLRPFDDSQLKSWTVPRLRGKNAIGNLPEAIQEHRYEDLEAEQGSLF